MLQHCPMLSQSWPHPPLQWMLHFMVGEQTFGLGWGSVVNFGKYFRTL